ncbi:MAG: hypothetical protein ACTS6G_05040 [Candidatus Hodgkinia cicadicola]
MEDLSRRQLVEKGLSFRNGERKWANVWFGVREASTNKTERSFQLLFDNAMTARKMIWLSRLKERTSVTEEPFGFEVKSMEVRGKKWYYELMVRFVSNGC